VEAGVTDSRPPLIDWIHPFAPDSLVGRYARGEIDWEEVKATLRERRSVRKVRRATYDGMVR
jgi:hypothetical protein